MAAITVDADLNLGGISKLIRAIINPVATDPVSPATGELWYNSTDGRLKFYNGSAVQTLAILSDVTGGAITGNLWNAQTVLVAVADNDPQPVTLGASTFIGRRSTGNAGAITFAQLIADENLATRTYADTAEADAIVAANAYTDAEIAAILGSASTLYDTLGEIQAFIESNDTEIAALIADKADVYSALIGNGALTDIAVTHNLGTTNVQVEVFNVSSGATVLCQVVRTNANTVTLSFNTAPGTNAYRAVVNG